MSIELIDVHKAFGPKQVLRGLSFEVGRGETLSLIGFSGAGKSTILKHVVGLMKPDRGTVRVDDMEVPKLRRTELYELRRSIGYVFQFAALFDSMTIGENIAMGLRKQGKLNEEQIRERVADSLDRVDLEGYEQRFPAELSGGQKKRAGLARAVAFRPRYLLYDEPTSGLDPVTTTTIDRLIRKMQADLGTTSLVITHDMESAYRISDRIAMLYEGRVVEEGTPDEMRRTRHPVVRGFVEGKPELVEAAEARETAAHPHASRTGER
ncbi:MAG TPA: ABC transporter ATP-binding protein [Longimicrobiaceae bacterium]|nr:ABC transporter ATP-binding protein [Longimicrobiaceae bacterium]